MNNRDLLKEAIADAKAVKETAIANAKAALEEAFAPQLRSMLSAKLEEMEKEETKEAETKVDEMKDSKEKVKEETSEPHGNIGAQTPEGEPLGFLEEEDVDEEVNLDEILAELDEEMGEDKDMNEAEEEAEVEVNAEEETEGEDEMEDEDIDLEEMSEDDLKSFIEDVIRDMVGSGELEAGEEFEMEDDMEMDGEMEDEESVEDEVEVDEIMEEEEVKEEKEDKMEEIMAEVNALKAELHEVNLLNAKLLYTNKIFRAKNLKEAQKVKVLEAFDKASNVKEVKLVFETLNEGIKETPKTQIKESLGSASKAAGVAPTKPIMEIDPQVVRWQKLAGIK